MQPLRRDLESQPAGRLPVVSVVVPVWNVEPYLRECLDSVITQSIGLENLEVIAVDDGSTDGSPAILDEYAARHAAVSVVHGPNSGGPGRPRNIGMDRARGTYLFFLDADDYLGSEALERLVAMAERNGADIVLGKLVGIEGRRLYRHAGPFRRNADKLPLGLAYRSGNVLKLFRLSPLRRTGIRFEEGLAGGEDGDFMAAVYPKAGTISVVADYDCYYVRRRAGSQTTRGDRRDDLAEYLRRIERERIGPSVAGRRPGPNRDVLVARNLNKIANLFRDTWLGLNAGERRRIFDVGAGIVLRWNTKLIQWVLPSRSAIRIYCLEHGLLRELEDIVRARPDDVYAEPIVEGRRVFARFPHFRDGSGIPDRCFDITRQIRVEQGLDQATISQGEVRIRGTAYLTLLGGRTWIEFRRFPLGPTLLFETTPTPTPDLNDGTVRYGMAGFSGAIQLGTTRGGLALGRGSWSIRLRVRAHDVRRSARLLLPRPEPPGVILAGTATTGAQARLRATAARELRLDIGVPSRAASLLEAGESALIRVRRAVVRAIASSSLGRVFVFGLELLRPDLASLMTEE